MVNSFYEKEYRIQNLEKGKGIKYLLDEAYDIIGNPIMMFDTSYTLLACNDVVTDDWVWNEILTFGTFRHETVDFFKRENFIEAFAVSETIAVMDSKHLKYKRVNGKLFDKDNVQLGNINVVACKKPFEEGDMLLIELFCEILSIELQNSDFYKKIDRVYQETLVSRIINGTITEDEISGNIPAQLYDGLKANLYLAVVDITHYDETNTHMAYFRDLFKKIQSEYKYYVHLNNIVIIISTDCEILSVKNELGELCAFFEKNKIYAGISSKFYNILELNKHFRESITALNYGLDCEKTQNIFFYDDFRIEHFLNSVVDSGTDICSPVILSIQKYDKENGETYFNTIYTYLLYGMNLALASGILGITREDLSNKLSRIEEIFEIDWTNGNMLFNIYFSIKYVNTFEKNKTAGQEY